MVIRMLTEIDEYGHKIEEKVKAMKSEIKKAYRESTVMGRKLGTHINGLDQKEEINNQSELNEETRIQKNEERLRNLQDNFKCSNIRIIGMSEGEEEEQDIENLFEQVMKENFPSLAKETDF